MMFGAYRNGVVKTNNEVPGGWSTIRKCALLSAHFLFADNSPENRIVRIVRERSMRLILPVTAQSGEPVPKGGICRGKRRWLL
jgi:hypothetical protein